METFNKSCSQFLRILFSLGISLWLVLAIFPMGCTSNPGVEVGNPTPDILEELEGLEITIDPESNDEPELYRVSVLDSNQARVIKFGQTTESLTVTILDPQSGSFSVQATFSDGRVVLILITYTNSTITNVSLNIDGAAIPSSFIVTGEPSSSTSCSTGTSNAGLLVLEALCNQVVSCTAISCEECRMNMLADSQWPNELGLDEAFGTFQDIADAVDDGSIIANQLALEQCTTDISNTTCNDLDNIGFDEVLGNYNQLEELGDMAPVCINVF